MTGASTARRSWLAGTARPPTDRERDEAWDKAEAALFKTLDVIKAEGLTTDVNPGKGVF